MKRLHVDAHRLHLGGGLESSEAVEHRAYGVRARARQQEEAARRGPASGRKGGGRDGHVGADEGRGLVRPDGQGVGREWHPELVHATACLVRAPSAMAYRVSARAATEASCVTMITAVSWERARSRNSSSTASALALSRTPVGSSAKTTAGRWTSALAPATRWPRPPRSAKSCAAGARRGTAGRAPPPPPRAQPPRAVRPAAAEGRRSPGRSAPGAVPRMGRRTRTALGALRTPVKRRRNRSRTFISGGVGGLSTRGAMTTDRPFGQFRRVLTELLPTGTRSCYNRDRSLNPPPTPHTSEG